MNAERKGSKRMIGSDFSRLLDLLQANRTLLAFVLGTVEALCVIQKRENYMADLLIRAEREAKSAPEGEKNG